MVQGSAQRQHDNPRAGQAPGPGLEPIPDRASQAGMRDDDQQFDRGDFDGLADIAEHSIRREFSFAADSQIAEFHVEVDEAKDAAGRDPELPVHFGAKVREVLLDRIEQHGVVQESASHDFAPAQCLDEVLSASSPEAVGSRMMEGRPRLFVATECSRMKPSSTSWWRIGAACLVLTPASFT